MRVVFHSGQTDMVLLLHTHTGKAKWNRTLMCVPCQYGCREKGLFCPYFTNCTFKVTLSVLTFLYVQLICFYRPSNLCLPSFRSLRHLLPRCRAPLLFSCCRAVVSHVFMFLFESCGLHVSCSQRVISDAGWFHRKCSTLTRERLHQSCLKRQRESRTVEFLCVWTCSALITVFHSPGG